MPKSVFISGKELSSYANMFTENGWDIVGNIEDADLVQFTGGPDVTPSLYGHTAHTASHFDAGRDHHDMMVFRIAGSSGKPMAGICRGAQFLHVMNGGKLYQDVTGHASYIGHPICFYPFSKKSSFWTRATSTHHQMMIPQNNNGTVIGVAFEAENRLVQSKKGAAFRLKTPKTEKMAALKALLEHRAGAIGDLKKLTDAEVILYEDTQCLCFQPHPEIGTKELEKAYFNMIDHHLLGDA